MIEKQGARGAAVVIATYNEANNIWAVLNGLRKHLVVVVDNASTDGTAGIVSQFSNVMLVQRAYERSLATAYLRGFGVARTLNPQWIIQMDAGLTHDPRDIPRLLAAAKAADTVATGTRFLPYRPPLDCRLLLSLAATRAARLLEVPTSDATCGFRCWPTELLQDITTAHLIQARGHVFQLEMLYRAWQQRGRIAQVPIEYKLTNSSLRKWEMWEALMVTARLLRQHYLILDC